jgi:uncharacterized NAD-dependent epimerase/dehydratase family protein
MGIFKKIGKAVHKAGKKVSHTAHKAFKTGSRIAHKAYKTADKALNTGENILNAVRTGAVSIQQALNDPALRYAIEAIPGGSNVLDAIRAGSAGIDEVGTLLDRGQSAIDDVRKVESDARQRASNLVGAVGGAVGQVRQDLKNTSFGGAGQAGFVNGGR